MCVTAYVNSINCKFDQLPVYSREYEILLDFLIVRFLCNLLFMLFTNVVSFF